MARPHACLSNGTAKLPPSPVVSPCPPCHGLHNLAEAWQRIAPRPVEAAHAATSPPRPQPPPPPHPHPRRRCGRTGWQCCATSRRCQLASWTLQSCRASDAAVTMGSHPDAKLLVPRMTACTRHAPSMRPACTQHAVHLESLACTAALSAMPLIDVCNSCSIQFC